SEPPVAARSLDLGEVDVERAAHLHSVLAGRHELLASRRRLEGVLVRELPLGVVAVERLAHRRPEDAPVVEGAAGYLATELGVLLLAARVGLLLVGQGCSDQSL